MMQGVSDYCDEILNNIGRPIYYAKYMRNIIISLYVVDFTLSWVHPATIRTPPY